MEVDCKASLNGNNNDLFDFLFDDELTSDSKELTSQQVTQYPQYPAHSLKNADSTSPDDFDVYVAVNMPDSYFDFMNATQLGMNELNPATISHSVLPSCEKFNNSLPNIMTRDRPGFKEGRRTRKRRKSNEIDRRFFCDYPLCHKSYGTITHLNTHRVSKGHGKVLLL